MDLQPSAKRKKGGPRPGSGRPPGRTNVRTQEERAGHAIDIARWARRAWKSIPESERPERPSTNNAEAARAWLNSRAMLVLDKAIESGDLKTAALVIEDCRNRLFGRPKFQHELGGIDGGSPISVSGAAVVFRCVDEVGGDIEPGGSPAGS